MSLKLSLDNALSFIDKGVFEKSQKELHQAYQMLINKNGAGNDFLGWLDYPNEISENMLHAIANAAYQIRRQSDVLLVIGIGGSYLGAKAIIEALSPYYSAEDNLEVIFVGHTLSATYTKELYQHLQNKDFSINVISKSGTTTEPAVAFRIFKELLEQKYGASAKERIFATTDPESGVLRKMANDEGYTTFAIPRNIGGRYSFLTAAGLLPIAAAGIDILALKSGAQAALIDAKFEQSVACQYALVRHLNYQAGKRIEIMVQYEPKLSYLSEWWKQLFGESEGKDHKGIFPASVVNSTDLHSLGQFIQEGERILFETVINVVEPEKDYSLTADPQNLDGLNFLSGLTLDEVNKKAMEGTIIAHVDGGVPNISFAISALNPFEIGYFMYTMMFACGVSAYLLGVNPFNQPGVEAYKKNMFALLKKPGYEELSEQLIKKLNK